MSGQQHYVDRILSRRETLELGTRLGLAAGAAALVGGRLFESAAAQDATPEAAFPPADLPVLEITFAADGSVSAAAESPAGTTTLRFVADGAPFISSVMFVRPDGLSDEDLEAGLASPEVPEWLHTTRVNGSVDFEPAAPGDAFEIVADLAPGTWYIVALAEIPAYTTVEISGDPVTVEIEAAVEVAFEHHDFTLPAEVPAGDQVWRATNVDDVLHHMVIFATQTLMTDEEVLAVLTAEGEEESTPEAEAGPPPVFPVGGIGILSKDEVLYQVVSLEPGFYAALCFLTDPGNPAPHAFVGMIESFTAV